MDKPRKSEAQRRIKRKRLIVEEDSEEQSGHTEDSKSFVTPKVKRKILSKKYNEMAKHKSRKSGTFSAKTTPSPSQRPDSNLSPILKLKLSAAELFNSAALTEHIYERNKEKTTIASYLSP